MKAEVALEDAHLLLEGRLAFAEIALLGAPVRILPIVLHRAVVLNGLVSDPFDVIQLLLEQLELLPVVGEHLLLRLLNLAVNIELAHLHERGHLPGGAVFSLIQLYTLEDLVQRRLVELLQELLRGPAPFQGCKRRLFISFRAQARHPVLRPLLFNPALR